MPVLNWSNLEVFRALQISLCPEPFWQPGFIFPALQNTPMTTRRRKPRISYSFIRPWQGSSGISLLSWLAASHPFCSELPSLRPQQAKIISGSVKPALQDLGGSSFLPRKLLFGTSSSPRREGRDRFQRMLRAALNAGDDTLMKTKINSM